MCSTAPVSVDRNGAPGYPTAAPWARWIDEHMRCVHGGPHGRCQLVRGHDQPHAVVLYVAAGKRAWRWHAATGGEPGSETGGRSETGGQSETEGRSETEGWLDDGGPWGNVATDRAPWIPGWP